MAEKQLGSSVKQRPSQCTKLLVAAIDFGTVYSGYAYSFRSEWPTVMTNKWSGGDYLSYKTPSALLLNPDQSFNSFGFDAEKRYACMTDNGKDCRTHFFFKLFKTILKSSLEKGVHRKTQCIAENGLSVDAMKVFTHCINHMRNHFLENLENRLAAKITMDDIDFVLTVPAIWDDTAKMFMREAAVQAGIRSNQLFIASEPEATLAFCQLGRLELIDNDKVSLARKEAGEKYMVINLGETTDVTIHQFREDGTLVEPVSTSEYSWGKVNIEKPFNEFLISLFGEKVMNIFNTDPKYREDYCNLWHLFKIKMCSFETIQDDDKNKYKQWYQLDKFVLQIPLAIAAIVAKQNKQNLQKIKIDAVINDIINMSQYMNKMTCEQGKLLIKSSFFKQLINPPIEILVNKLKKVYTDIGHDLKLILMVGGITNCTLVQKTVKKEFEGKCRVIVPNQPDQTVVKGAVYLGHQPDMISERVSKYSYGIQTWPAFNVMKHLKAKRVQMENGPRCKDVFLIFVAKGDVIKPGARVSYTFKALISNAKTHDCAIFISNKTRPVFVFNKKEGLFDSPLNPLCKSYFLLSKIVYDKMRTNVINIYPHINL